MVLHQVERRLVDGLPGGLLLALPARGQTSLVRSPDPIYRAKLHSVQKSTVCTSDAGHTPGAWARRPVPWRPMCGIVAVLRQPSTVRDAGRPAPSSSPWTQLGGADRGDLTARRPPLQSAAGRAPDVDASCGAPPGWRCLLGAPATVEQGRRSGPSRIGARIGGVRGRARPATRWTSARPRQEEVNAALVAPQGSPGGPSSGTGWAWPGGVADLLGGPTDERAEPRRLVGDPGRPGLARPPGGPGPGLGRNPRAGRGPRPGPRRSGGSGPCSRARTADPLFRSGRVRTGPGVASASSTRPRPRSASSATTSRPCGRRIRADALLARALAAPACPGHGRRPHPLGQRRASSPSPTPTRSTPRRLRPARRSLCGRRAQRRRRQPRRPAAPRACACRRDHDRRQGHPGPVSRRLAEGLEPWTRPSGGTVAPFEGSVAIAAAIVGGPRRAAPGACAAPASASTSAWPRTPSWWPASRTAWWRRPPGTCAWTARQPRARSSCSTGTAPGRSAGMTRGPATTAAPFRSTSAT